MSCVRRAFALSVSVAAAALAVSCAGAPAAREAARAAFSPSGRPFEAPGRVSPSWVPLAPGVDYAAFAVVHPRMEAYAIRANLSAPGVSIVVTGGSGDPSTTLSRKTSSFLAQNRCVAAVNANPFDPSSATEGEKRRIVGLSVSGGLPVSPAVPKYAALLFRKNGTAAVVSQRDFEPSPDVENAVGGFFIVLRDGVPAGTGTRRFPRTAAGASPDGTVLYLLVVDGRRAGSRGATETETGTLLERLGAADGLILDGGGSSTLAVRGSGGESVVVNVPVHGGRKGAERAVGNSLGVRSPQ